MPKLKSTHAFPLMATGPWEQTAEIQQLTHSGGATARTLDGNTWTPIKRA